VLAVSAPVDCEPDVALVPLQPPDAVQALALVDDQLKLAAPPLVTDVGLAASDSVGAGGGGGVLVTVTVTDWVTLPPAPVQVSEKLPVAVSAAVVWLPLVALVPDQAPDAVQPLALADDQLSVAVAPLATDVGLAPKLNVGAGVGCGGGGVGLGDGAGAFGSMTVAPVVSPAVQPASASAPSSSAALSVRVRCQSGVLETQDM